MQSITLRQLILLRCLRFISLTKPLNAPPTTKMKLKKAKLHNTAKTLFYLNKQLININYLQ